MKKYCQICGKEFETIPNGEGRKLCFECSPTDITSQERTSYKRKAIKSMDVILEEINVPIAEKKKSIY